MLDRGSQARRVILVHYHEIGLKGHNRKSFEKRLLRNLEALANDMPVSRFQMISGRILAFLDDGTPVEAVKETCRAISRIPGVARASAGYECDRDLEAMAFTAIEALREVGEFESFKVNARRAHTDFPIDSMTLNREIGSMLCSTFPEASVRMKAPDVEVRVEVIQANAYVYAHSVVGIGGLPVGSSGKVCCLLSSGIDSPVATWRMARRGATCIGIHFSGRPQTEDTSEYLVDEICQKLSETGCISKLFTVPIGDHQRKISVEAPPPLRVILYRRLMMATAQNIAYRVNAGALVTGESLGQVASQTLQNIQATDEASTLPVFRPLIGTDKQEIIKEAHELGTFDISTQDAPDCCTLFMPRNPETHANLDDVLRAESAYPMREWAEALAEAAEPKSYM